MCSRFGSGTAMGISRMRAVLRTDPNARLMFLDWNSARRVSSFATDYLCTEVTADQQVAFADEGGLSRDELVRAALPYRDRSARDVPTAA